MPKDCNSSKLDRIELTYSTAPPNGTQHQVPHQLMIGLGYTRINSYFGFNYILKTRWCIVCTYAFGRLNVLKSVITYYYQEISISGTYLLRDPTLVSVPF